MSIIKQLATYDGSTWTTDDIGANASNVSLTTDVAGQNNVQSALNHLCGTSVLTGSRMVVTNTGGVLTTSTPTPERALVSAATTGIPTASVVTSTELGYLSGVTSNIQTQIDTLNNNLLTIYDTGEYDLDNFTQNKHYWIFFEAECVLTHLPSYQNSSRGWLEILPSENNVSSSSNFIKQIWHTYNGSKYYRFKSPLEEWTLWQSSDYRFISNTIANRDLNDFTTPGKYYFEFKNGQSILNAPFSAYNGWLEVLPTFGGEAGVKQIWHRLGSQSTVGGEEGYGQEAVRLYIPTQGTTSAHWTTWKKLLVIDEDKKPFKYVTITDLSLSVTANGTSGLFIDSTNNKNIFNTKYKQNGYTPFALYQISWTGGAGNVYLQTYKINTGSFYLYIGNRASSAQSLTGITIGLMYYKQGLMD